MKIAESILTGAKSPGIYRLTTRVKPTAILEGFAEAGWQSFYINGLKVYDKDTFLHSCATAMHFPDYFGHNWDAFEECIRDLAPAKGYVLLYDHVAQFAGKEFDEWRTALDILADAVGFWNKTKTPMYVLLRHTESYARNLRAW